MLQTLLCRDCSLQSHTNVDDVDAFSTTAGESTLSILLRCGGGEGMLKLLSSLIRLYAYKRSIAVCCGSRAGQCQSQCMNSRWTMRLS